MKQHRNLKIASPDPKENYVINPDFANFAGKKMLPLGMEIKDIF